MINEWIVEGGVVGEENWSWAICFVEFMEGTELSAD